jgi:hypothetical protein
MEVTPPPLMLVDPPITPREGVSGASLNKVDQPTSSGLGSAAPVLGEQLNIRELDVVGALLILIAEVREALTLVPNSPLQPIVPQSLVPEENLLEQSLLENVIPESPPSPGLVFVEPALPEIALDSSPALQLISATASPSPAQTVATEISRPMSPLLQCLVHQGMTPWPSSSGVLLAEAALINAALRDIYSTPGASPAQLGPATAPFAVIQMMLRRLPAEESERPAAWLVTATQVEAAVRTALDKAFDAVTASRSSAMRARSCSPRWRKTC